MSIVKIRCVSAPGGQCSWSRDGGQSDLRVQTTKLINVGRQVTTEPGVLITPGTHHIIRVVHMQLEQTRHSAPEPVYQRKNVTKGLSMDSVTNINIK